MCLVLSQISECFSKCRMSSQTKCLSRENNFYRKYNMFSQTIGMSHKVLYVERRVLSHDEFLSQVTVGWQLIQGNRIFQRHGFLSHMSLMHNNYRLTDRKSDGLIGGSFEIIRNIAPCDRICHHLLHLLQDCVSKQVLTRIKLFHLRVEAWSFHCIQLTHLLHGAIYL